MFIDKLAPLNKKVLELCLITEKDFLIRNRLSIRHLLILLHLTDEGSTLADLNKLGFFNQREYLYSILKKLRDRGLIGKSGLQYYLTGRGVLTVQEYIHFCEKQIAMQ